MIVAWILLAVLTYYCFTKLKRKNEPPGPFKWPILGNFLDLYFADSKYPQLALQKLADVYGEVMTIDLGVHKMVVLSSFETIRELMKKEELSHRYELPFVRERAFGKPLGLIHGSGEAWGVLRRFTISTLKEYGFGKKCVMEDAMKFELTELLGATKRRLRETGGVLVFDNFFGISVVNILWTSVSGRRFLSTDKKAEAMIELNAKYSKFVSIDHINVLFPFVRHVMPGLTGFNQLQNIIKELQDFMRSMIREAQTGKSGNGPTCFIGAFVQQIENNVHPVFTEEHLIVVLMDLFLGGSETTSNMLSFAILYMATHPEVQNNVQREIDQVADGSEFLSLADSKRMPYTQATTLEIFRLAQVIPIPFGREATTDIQINGFRIPKGSLVAYNLNSIQMDPKFWKDPGVFRPERFLNPELNIINEDRVPVFGFGKRVCPGEILARNSFFMYFTTMLKNFDFKVIPGEAAPSILPRPNSNTQAPMPFSIMAQGRRAGTHRK